MTVAERKGETLFHRRDHIVDDYDDILAAVCDAWSRLIAEPTRIASIGS
jgi:hypothetical protein